MDHDPWLPIATFVDDGQKTRIDLWIPGRGRMCNAFWNGEYWSTWTEWRRDRNPVGGKISGCHRYALHVDLKPSHWKPTDLPPTEFRNG